MDIIPFAKPRLVSKKMRASAKGQQCTLRLAGCNRNPETTVLCHINIKGRSGIGQKPNDNEACYGCSHCHDVIDGRVKGVCTDADKLRAVFETQEIMRNNGLIEYK